MAVNFKYLMIEINGKPVLVDKKALNEASQSLREEVKKIKALTDGVLKNGFAVETPEGMTPVRLGSAEDFSVWVSAKMGGSFDLSSSIGTLPSPFKEALGALVTADLVIYSASLFYTGDTGDVATQKKLYGELVLGVQFPPITPDSFPLALREVVIEVDNYPPTQAQPQTQQQ
jgi:hypothetical protein